MTRKRGTTMVRALSVFAAVLAATSIHDARAHSLNWQGERGASSNNLVYYGGPVLSHVKVSIVFWGTSVDPKTVSDIGGFYQIITLSSRLYWLNEYNTNLKALDGRDGTHQSIGRGSVQGEYTIQPHNTDAKLTN